MTVTPPVHDHRVSQPIVVTPPKNERLQISGFMGDAMRELRRMPQPVPDPYPWPKVEPQRFSVSMLKMYMECSLAAHFRYDLHLQRPQNAAASFGNIIHMALKYLNDTEDYPGAVQQFKDNWARPDLIGLDPGYWPRSTSYGSYHQLGLEILKKFWDDREWDKREVIGTEIEFCVPFGEHELHGFIDLLELRRSGNGQLVLRVVDYKTGSWKPSKAELALDIQFTGYLWAVDQPEFWLGNGPAFPGVLRDQYERLKNVPRRGIWFHLRKGSEHDVGKRTDVNYLQLYRAIAEVAKARALGVNLPRIGKACELCDYTADCPLEIPVDLSVKDDDPDRWI